MENITSEEDEESEPKEIRRITKINQTLPDNNDHYGIEMKINGKNKNSPLTSALRLWLGHTEPQDKTLYQVYPKRRTV